MPSETTMYHGTLTNTKMHSDVSPSSPRAFFLCKFKFKTSVIIGDIYKPGGVGHNVIKIWNFSAIQ